MHNKVFFEKRVSVKKNKLNLEAQREPFNFT